jgi:GNAT superfamily N-acetyltransferase
MDHPARHAGDPLGRARGGRAGWRRQRIGVTEGIRVIPANQASWEDIQAVFGTRGSASYCQCQRYKLAPKEAFSRFPAEERAMRLREQTQPDTPHAESTTGLVAYLDDEPVGWCAVQPRTEYPSLLRVYRTPWDGRAEDKADSSVWSVTCVFVRAGYRKRGIAYALAAAAVRFARERGARALEAYPMRTEAGEITWDEIHVGAQGIFAAAGMSEVSRPGIRRAVMRIDYH